MRSSIPSLQVLKRFLLGLILIWLAGCQATVFESPPAGARVACDPRLVGHWLGGEWSAHGARNPKRGHPDTERLSVLPKDCGLILRRTGQCPSDLIGYRFSYLPDRDGGYLIATVAGRDEQPASCRRMSDREDDLSADASQPKRGRHRILRYRIEPDRVSLYNLDTLRVARLILAGSVPGSVVNNDSDSDSDGGAIESVAQLDAVVRKAKADGEELQIVASVRGTSAQTDALLASRKDLFFATPGMILVRDGQPPSPAAGRSTTTPAGIGSTLHRSKRIPAAAR